MRRPSSLPTHSRASDQLDRMEIKAAEKAIEKAASLENADRGSIATILRKLCDISVLASLLGADAERKAHIMHSKLPTAWLQAVEQNMERLRKRYPSEPADMRNPGDVWTRPRRPGNVLREDATQRLPVAGQRR